MTELERQLTEALERLSEHSERERQQHAEQIEALRMLVEQQAERSAALQRLVERQDAESDTLQEQFERLDGQVRGLAQDYRTLAETLREHWR